MKIILGGTVYDGVTAEFVKYDMAREVTGIRLWQNGEYGEELLATATVNVPGVVPEAGCVLIKDYGENEGMLDSLIREGVVEPTGRTVRSGFVTILEARLIGEWAEQIDEKGKN